MEDTPEKVGKVVKATFKGTGTKKIMLIAPMDTVYPSACSPSSLSARKATRPTAWHCR